MWLRNVSTAAWMSDSLLRANYCRDARATRSNGRSDRSLTGVARGLFASNIASLFAFQRTSVLTELTRIVKDRSKLFHSSERSPKGLSDITFPTARYVELHESQDIAYRTGHFMVYFSRLGEKGFCRSPLDRWERSRHHMPPALNPCCSQQEQRRDRGHRGLRVQHERFDAVVQPRIRRDGRRRAVEVCDEDRIRNHDQRHCRSQRQRADDAENATALIARDRKEHGQYDIELRPPYPLGLKADYSL